VIEIAGLGHRFGDRDVFDDVDLVVPAGGFTSLIGPSGCGKSTVLRVLAGLLEPACGVARINGADVAGRPGQAAFMPQRDVLLPWRRVVGNAIVGAEAHGRPRAEARREALALLDRFGLAGFERSWPAQLSGGMRQRLALLRTFVSGLDVLLLDEPFGALDALTRRELQVWLEEVWRADARRRTVLLVTHDVGEALLLSDQVVVLSPRPGRVVAVVEVDLPRPRPAGIVTTPAFAALEERLLRALGVVAGA